MAGKLPKMKLWCYPTYRSARCVWLAKELGIEDQLELVTLPMETQPPPPEREEYRQHVHPHSTIPALEVEGQPPLLESAAICLFLADLCGSLAPELDKRAEYYNWIIYSCCTMDEILSTLTFHWELLPPEKRDQQVIDKTLPKAKVCMDYIEKTLEGREYILGKEFTAADCILGYNIWWASLKLMKDGILVEGRPNIQSYLARISARPAMKEAMKEN